MATISKGVLNPRDLQKPNAAVFADLPAETNMVRVGTVIGLAEHETIRSDSITGLQAVGFAGYFEMVRATPQQQKVEKQDVMVDTLISTRLFLSTVAHDELAAFRKTSENETVEFVGTVFLHRDGSYSVEFARMAAGEPLASLRVVRDAPAPVNESAPAPVVEPAPAPVEPARRAAGKGGN
jgi:hypothetical protein